jgi:glutamine amidotransferase
VIAVVDYGAGNIHSVARALARVGAEFEVTDQPASIAAAQGVVLPGVGAAADTMHGLRSRGVDEPVVQAIARGVPYLGICMGFQVLFESSEEDEETPCLGVLPGRVRRLRPGLHVPHMGWNQVHQVRDTPLLAGIGQDANFYFVHAYYPQPAEPTAIAATTDYGVSFASAVAQDNLFAVQFHPEKSGDVGLRVYANFVGLAGQAPNAEPPAGRQGGAAPGQAG